MKEDHTLGNLISEHLKMHPKVHMAGYKGLYRLNLYHVMSRDPLILYLQWRILMSPNS